MNAEQFVTPQSRYAAEAQRASGAQPTSGMPPYPLYGIGQAEAEVVPFYRRPFVCFGAGALVVGGIWAYFGWWRPRSQKKQKKNARKSRTEKLREELAQLEAAED